MCTKLRGEVAQSRLAVGCQSWLDTDTVLLVFISAPFELDHFLHHRRVALHLALWIRLKTLVLGSYPGYPYQGFTRIHLTITASSGPGSPRSRDWSQGKPVPASKANRHQPFTEIAIIELTQNTLTTENTSRGVYPITKRALATFP